MTDLAVIYDPTVEMSALVDTDTMRALGPVGVGPNSQGELGRFADSIPEALIMTATSFDLVTAWAQFWQANFDNSAATPVAGENGAVESGPDPAGVPDRSAAAEASANAGQPPAPAPFDTDMGADQSQTPAVTAPAGTQVDSPPAPAADPHPPGSVCFVCDGSGRVPGAVAGETATCNLCQGTGVMQAAASS